MLSNHALCRPAIAFSVFSLAGCTLLQPVAAPPETLKIPIHQAPQTGGQVEVPADPPASNQGTASCVQMPECGAGDIGPAIAAVQNYAFEFGRKAAEAGNTNPTYNALLWPVAAAALYEPLRSSSRSMLPAVALLATSYGLVNSGIPERASLYNDTAKRLSCIVMVASETAWPRVAIEGPDKASEVVKVTKPAKLDKPAETVVLVEVTNSSLVNTVRALNTALGKFNQKRAELVYTLKVKPQPSGSDTLSRRSGNRGGGVSDPRKEIQENASAMAAYATTTRDEAQVLLDRIRTSGREVLADAQRVGFQDQAALISKLPALKLPAEVFTEIAKLRTDIAALAEGKLQKPEPSTFNARALNPLLITLKSHGLDEGSLNKLIEFEIKEAEELRKATDAARAWISRDTARRELAQKRVDSGECKSYAASTLTLPSSPPIGVANRGGSREPTNATFGTTTTRPLQ